MLQVSHLTRTFTSGTEEVQAVNDMDFSVERGEFVSIIGKSGSGKSTLLSMLGALDKPTGGTIKVDGEDIASMSDAKLIRYRCHKIGFVFQSYNLIPNLTAIENVMLPMEFAGRDKEAREKRATELLEQVGIEPDQMERKPGKLSGGQQQRVSIARALANKPSVILADEPTGNLDEQTGKMVFDLLHTLAKQEKTTIIVVTHDLDIAGKTDRTFRLNDGKIREVKK
ncbi:MAG: ABC transporter related protein [Candidatus Saccharibacteria bacterium GW2011_GWC2_48_9]|nr:MAG: ABC transporter related protein [Candidatus Saccharibacteria bacterium GW2011_GWC2_48_9]HCH34347.1 ABC transporter [Candidatus Saccharibacteria bacterium]